jgi:hypothetical protein
MTSRDKKEKQRNALLINAGLGLLGGRHPAGMVAGAGTYALAQRLQRGRRDTRGERVKSSVKAGGLVGGALGTLGAGLVLRQSPYASWKATTSGLVRGGVGRSWRRSFTGHHGTLNSRQTSG